MRLKIQKECIQKNAILQKNRFQFICLFDAEFHEDYKNVSFKSTWWLFYLKKSKNRQKCSIFDKTHLDFEVPKNNWINFTLQWHKNMAQMLEQFFSFKWYLSRSVSSKIFLQIAILSENLSSVWKFWTNLQELYTALSPYKQQ